MRTNHRWIWVVLILFTLPALILSLNTPFALVDDYTDWRSLSILTSWSQFIGFWKQMLQGIGRYRPLYELTNAVNWYVLGPNPTLHHLERWLKKALIVVFWWQISKIWFSSLPQRKLFFWAFIGLFWFLPNCPDARLVPQETHMVMAWSWLTLWLSRWAITNNFELARSGWGEYAFGFFALIVLSWSKEPAVLLLLPTAGVLLVFNQTWSIKACLRYMGIAVIVGWTFYRIKVAQQNMSHGLNPFTGENVVRVWEAVTQYTLFWDYVKVCSVIVFVGLVGLRGASVDRDVNFVKLVNLLKPVNQRFFYASFCFVFSAIVINLMGTPFLPQLFLRYYYPHTFFWTVGAVALLGFFLKKGILEKRWQRLTVVIACTWFAVVHLNNYYYQYELQYNAWNHSDRMLNDIKGIVGSKILAIDRLEVGEEESKIQSYFTEFLPHFYGKSLQAISVNDQQFSNAQYLISRLDTPLPGWRLVKQYRSAEWFRSSHWAGKISRLLRWPRRLDFWQDGGAMRLVDYRWDLYERDKN